jgi:hypothetical protein
MSKPRVERCASGRHIKRCTVSVTISGDGMKDETFEDVCLKCAEENLRKTAAEKHKQTNA